MKQRKRVLGRRQQSWSGNTEKKWNIYAKSEPYPQTFLRNWNHFLLGTESVATLKAEVSFIDVNFSLNCFTTCFDFRAYSVLSGSQHNYYAKMAYWIIYYGHIQSAHIWKWHIPILRQSPIYTLVIWPHLSIRMARRCSLVHI